jgi:nucleotidyltransferase AbiEii toxin of type IV toxin-antitoxin system
VDSRMKDFYDIWTLSRTFNFNGEILAEAVKKTFENRKTPLNLNSVVFDPSFGKDKARNVQWQGFIRKAKLVNAPDSFKEVIAELKIFLVPIASSIDMGQAFTSRWTAPGPWH